VTALPTVPLSDTDIFYFPPPVDELPVPDSLMEHALELLEAADILAGLCAHVRMRRELWQGVILAQQGMDEQIIEKQYEGMGMIHGAALFMSTQDSRDGMRPLWRGLVHGIRILVRDAQGS
jgi:hypothetical protein